MEQHTIGDASYDCHEFGTEWWYARSQDGAHQAAYERIAQYAGEHLQQTDVRVIIDYACGAGFLVRHMLAAFPNAQVIGIDESQQAVDAARMYLEHQLTAAEKKRVRIERHALPDFNLSLPPADLVLFSFPDFRVNDAQAWARHWKQQRPDDWKGTQALRRRLGTLYPDLELSPSRELFIKRLASMNMHALMRPTSSPSSQAPAHCIRIEYAACERHECHPFILEEMHWYEGAGAHDSRVQNAQRDKRTAYHFIESTFMASQVIDDVYAQTGDEDDREGGFMMSLFACAPAVARAAALPLSKSSLT